MKIMLFSRLYHPYSGISTKKILFFASSEKYILMKNEYLLAKPMLFLFVPHIFHYVVNI